MQGQHDYKSFCANPQMKNPPSASSIPSTSAAGRTTSIYVPRYGLLQNMVRILVGTLLEVGRGAMDAQQVSEILEAKDRRLAGPTAPPQGLCLVKVDY